MLLFKNKKNWNWNRGKKYYRTMELMLGSKSFDELYQYHCLWINGKIKGYGYSRITLKKIDGGSEFISLLRRVTENLMMVTTSSQPSNHSFQKSLKKPIIVYCIPEILKGKMKMIKEIEILYKPYITGMVRKDMFFRILSIQQKELSIIGRLPYLDTSEVVIKDKCIKYNAEYDLFCRNVEIIDDGIILTRFIFHCKNADVYQTDGYGIWFHNYGPSSDQHLEALDKKNRDVYDWRDHELCEITIFVNNFECNKEEFKRLIEDFCNRI